MSSAAKKMMERFGWKDGEGLGKNKDGMTTYVKVVRRDPKSATGLGHAADPAQAGNAASTQAVELDAMYSQIKSSTSRKARRASGDTSVDTKRARSASSSSDSSSSASSPASSSSDSDSDSSAPHDDVTRMSDAELLRRCGNVRLGRAGRHRVFNGKLARIEQNDRKNGAGRSE